jgi:hypothetical protein
MAPLFEYTMQQLHDSNAFMIGNLSNPNSTTPHVPLRDAAMPGDSTLELGAWLGHYHPATTRAQ